MTYHNYRIKSHLLSLIYKSTQDTVFIYTSATTLPRRQFLLSDLSSDWPSWSAFPNSWIPRESISYWTFTLQFQLLQKLFVNQLVPHLPYSFRYLRIASVHKYFNFTLFHWFVHFNNNYNCWVPVTSQAILDTGAIENKKRYNPCCHSAYMYM